MAIILLYIALMLVLSTTTHRMSPEDANYALMGVITAPVLPFVLRAILGISFLMTSASSSAQLLCLITILLHV